MKVMRRWKRDGSVNYMSLDAAAEHLKRNSKQVQKYNREQIKEKLRMGEKLETIRCTFSIMSSVYDIRG